MIDDNDRTPGVAWNELKTILDRAQRFVVTSHVAPDCDALGSELAMAALLEGLGKHVRIVNSDRVPPRLAFIDSEDRIEVLHSDVKPAELDEFDVIIVLDTSAWAQLGGMADVIRRDRAQVVVIDHHVSDGELGGLCLKDDRAEATGRLIVEFANSLELPISSHVAQMLFAAIATDTGWFRFSSTTGSTYGTAAQLIEAGARPHEIYRQLYERDSLGRAKLRGVVLSHISVELDGKLVHTYVSAGDFEDTGARRSETEDFVNMALAIDGSEVAVMLTEQVDGTIKASFRSRGSLDCSAIAALFGGGGHKAAAGATPTGAFRDVQTRVLDAVRAAMNSSDD